MGAPGLKRERLLVCFFLTFIVTAQLYRWDFILSSEGGHSAAAQLLGRHFVIGLRPAFVSDVGTAIALSVLLLCRLPRTAAASVSTLRKRFELGALHLILAATAMTLACELYVITERVTLGTGLLLVLGNVVFLWLVRRRGDKSNRFIWFLVTLTVVSFVYGLLLTWALREQRRWSPSCLQSSFAYCLFFGSVSLLAIGCWKTHVRAVIAAAGALWPRFSMFVHGVLVLVLCATSMLIHYRLVQDFGSGLTTALVLQSMGRFRPGDIATFSSTREWLFLAVPAVLLCVTYRLHYWRPRWMRGIAAGLLVLGIAVWALPRQAVEVRAELVENPLEFLASDFISNQLFRPSWAYGQERRLPGPEQMHSLKLVDPAFVAERGADREPLLQLPTTRASTHPWNVLIFVMESTGADYVFDTSEGNAVPMPFFKHLAQEGVYLNNHYTTAGSSAEAGFSLFTGLYPCGGSWSGSDADIYVPTINRFFGSRYNTFLIHPTRFSMAFAHHLLVNNGIVDLFDRTAMSTAGEPDVDSSARNEKASIRFLLEKLDTIPAPFTGIYWSFVPHYPYTDYGSEYRLFPVSDNERHRYYNNLRLLDEQIKTIYDHLAACGRLQDTILVFVGDHGEGFGQHFGIWKHGFRNFGEIAKTPALLWQPALFPPQRVEGPTSHVDILPTLLDAAGIPYNDQLLQGESLFRRSDRKYVFTLAKFEDRLALVSESLLKVSLSFKSGEGLAYDLTKNPGETLPLPLRRFPAETDALIKFHNYQLRIYSEYNQTAHTLGADPSSARLASQFGPTHGAAAPF